MMSHPRRYEMLLFVMSSNVGLGLGLGLGLELGLELALGLELV